MRSPQYMSALKQYEIDLRGAFRALDDLAQHARISLSFQGSIQGSVHAALSNLGINTLCAGNKIAVIENLGTTENQFDSIDLSDNAVVRLEGFPRLLRLKQLLLNNNRIARINKACCGKAGAAMRWSAWGLCSAWRFWSMYGGWGPLGGFAPQSTHSGGTLHLLQTPSPTWSRSSSRTTGLPTSRRVLLQHAMHQVRAHAHTADSAGACTCAGHRCTVWLLQAQPAQPGGQPCGD